MDPLKFYFKVDGLKFGGQFYKVRNGSLEPHNIPSDGDLIEIVAGNLPFFSHGVFENFRLVNPELSILDTIYFTRGNNILLFQIIPTSDKKIGQLRFIRSTPVGVNIFGYHPMNNQFKDGSSAKHTHIEERY